MKKVNLKVLPFTLLTSISVLLTGCGSKESTSKKAEAIISYNQESSIHEVEENSSASMPIEEIIIDNEVKKEEPAIPNVTETSKEMVVENPISDVQAEVDNFTFFSDAREEIDGYASNNDWDNLKTKGKYYVVTGIDFIFYNQPIKGVYFSELTDDLKAGVMNDVKLIDGVMTHYFPNYKETIGSKYRVVADFLGDKYLFVLDKIRGYLGDENYEAVGEIKDQIIGDLGKQKDKALNFIQDKYNNWKND